VSALEKQLVPPKTRPAPKSVVGQVVSNKMQKTVVVAVEWTIIHPQYKKVVRRTTRYMAHDEQGCGIGDRVQLIETRPLSKRKRWRVVSIVERSARTVPAPEEPAIP
jgi:small subunit ribosomal protein S17